METTPAGEILNEAYLIVKTLEPLFYSHLKNAERHNLGTIEISRARAKEIAMDLMILKKKITTFMEMQTKAQSATDQHLDKMFGIN